jgi:hypothetical protein
MFSGFYIYCRRYARVTAIFEVCVIYAPMELDEYAVNVIVAAKCEIVAVSGSSAF